MAVINFYYLVTSWDSFSLGWPLVYGSTFMSSSNIVVANFPNFTELFSYHLFSANQITFINLSTVLYPKLFDAKSFYFNSFCTYQFGYIVDCLYGIAAM